MRFLPKSDSSTFMCFSPPVMLATLVLEFGFATYILVTSKLRPATTLIISLLICLGIFQLAEYQVCAGAHTVPWMKLGYAAITLLPALNLHLISIITKRPWARYTGYVLAVVIIGYFLFSTQSINTAICGGNYVLINTRGVIADTYFPLYYAVTLALALAEILSFSVGSFGEKKTQNARSALYWLLAGIGTFLIPTGAIYLVSPQVQAGIPSIMCGFAVFFAVILTVFVYPLCRKMKV
ncbi:MAG: hypothetical protein WCO52_02055 [bacterium]